MLDIHGIQLFTEHGNGKVLFRKNGQKNRIIGKDCSSIKINLYLNRVIPPLRFQ